MFWDNQAAEELLQERYPWFMDTWLSYPRVVHRGGLHTTPAGLHSLAERVLFGPLLAA